MIELKEVLTYHDELIKVFGGASGLRDKNLLLSALARPYMTFDQQELYPTAVEKAGAVFESIVINHPFLDGNKRTAFLLLRLILLVDNYDLLATEDEKYDFTITASMGNLNIDQITNWIREKLITTNP